MVSFKNFDLVLEDISNNLYVFLENKSVALSILLIIYFIKLFKRCLREIKKNLFQTKDICVIF